VELREYAGFLERGDPSQLALGLGLLLLAFPVLQALRLHVVVRRYTGSVGSSFSVFMVGAFFNTMLPSNVGGDAVRLLYLRRMRADNWGGPFAMLMLHRATGLGVLLVAAAVHAVIEHDRLSHVLAGVELGAGPSHGVLALGALALVAGGFGLLLLLRSQHRLALRARAFAIECWRATTEVGAGAMSALVALTALLHFVRMLAFYVLVRYMGQRIGLWDLLPVLAATALAGIVPLTVGGLGLMEGAISVTLALFGVSQAAGVGAALANRLVLVLTALLGGATYVVSGGPGLRKAALAGAVGEGESARSRVR